MRDKQTWGVRVKHNDAVTIADGLARCRVDYSFRPEDDCIGYVVIQVYQRIGSTINARTCLAFEFEQATGRVATFAGLPAAMKA